MRNKNYHNIKAIFNREILTTFNSPMALIFFFVFAATSSYFFTSPFFIIGQSDLRGLFSVIPLLYLILIPAITMSMISRDWNLGTMEIMKTLPITDYEYVLGKFFSAILLVITSLSFTLIHVITVYRFGTEIDTGAIICGYFGLILLGAFYASIGIFASSISSDQIVAFIIGVFLVLVFYLMDKTILIFTPPFMASFIQYLAVDYHLTNISRGVIDSRNIIYFFSIISFFLFMTIRLLESRKWK